MCCVRVCIERGICERLGGGRVTSTSGTAEWEGESVFEIQTSIQALNNSL